MTEKESSLGNLEIIVKKLERSFWQSPGIIPKIPIGSGRGIFPPNLLEQSHLFLRLSQTAKAPPSKLISDPDLHSLNKHLSIVFKNKDINYQRLADLSLAYAQQSKSVKEQDDIVSHWLAFTRVQKIAESLTGYGQFCQEMREVYPSLEKQTQFSQVLIKDVEEINCQKEIERNQICLVNLRRTIAKELLARLGLLKLSTQFSEEQSLIKIISDNPETYYFTLALEKLYLTELVKKLKPNMIQKNEQLNKLNIKTDDIASARLMNQLENSQSDSKILLEQSPQTLLITLLNYYFNNWSRAWPKDQEYAAYFQGENQALVGSCLPLDNQQLVIPDVSVNKESIQDLITKKCTDAFSLNLLPALNPQITAFAQNNQLSLHLANVAIGHFTGERMTN